MGNYIEISLKDRFLSVAVLLAATPIFLNFKRTFSHKNTHFRLLEFGYVFMVGMF